MKRKHEYFWMHGTEPTSGGGMAYTPKDYDSFVERAISGNKRVISSFKKLDEIPCTFTISKGLLFDYLETNIAYPLVSIRLKEAIDANTTIKLYRWLRAIIKDTRTNEITIYYMPLFENKVDTINYEKSKYLDEEKTNLVVPCFSLEKIKSLDFFPKHDETYNKSMEKETPYFVDHHLIVSKKLKNIIRKNKLTGIRFEKEWVVDDLVE